MTDIKSLLDYISGPESNGNYNAYYGNANNQSINLTGMTLGQVQAYQDDLRKRTGSSAVGRYQFMYDTLGGLIQENGLSPDTIFTPELQDHLGFKLLERRGYHDFASGKMNAVDFGNSLAQEWAGLPMLSGPKAGRSYYDGDAIGNKSGVSANSFLAAITGVQGAELPVSLNPRVAPGTPLGQFVQSNAPSPTGQSQTSFQVGGPSTVGIGQILPTTPLTYAEMQAQEAARAEADSISLVEGLGIAVSQEQILPWLLKGRPQFTPVRGHQTDWDEATKDIPEEYWDRFTDSSSPAQDAFIRKGIMDDLEADRKLGSLGGMGIALRIGAAVTDPLAWAAGAGIAATTGGTGLAPFLAAKFGRVGMIAHGAAVGAASALPTEAALMAYKPTYNWDDAAISVGAGLILGGTFGAIGKNPAIKDQAQMLVRAGEKQVLAEIEKQGMGGSSVGAMQAAVREDLRRDAYDWVRDGAELVRKPFAGFVRYDLAGRFLKAKNIVTNVLGQHLVEDGARAAGDDVTEIGASEVASRLNMRSGAQWKRTYTSSLNAYMKRLEVPRNKRAEVEAQFSEGIARFVRNRDPMVEFDPEIVQAGNHFRGMMQKWREIAANPGVLDGTKRRAVGGFENAKDNPNYVPRIFDLGSIQNHIRNFGQERLAKLVAKGMKEVNEDISDDLAMKFGKGYIHRLHQLSAGDLQKHAPALSGEDMEGLKALLRDGTDLSETELDDLLLGMKKDTQTGATTRGKHRLFYDEDFAQQIEALDGSGLKTVRISDLFNNDADALMQLYNRQMSGRIAMARLRIKNPSWHEDADFDEFLVDGITNDSEWATLMEKSIAVGDAQGARMSPDEAAALKTETLDDIKRMQFAYDNIIGRPHWDEAGGYAQGLRIARDYNFIRVMGQVGFAQLPEAANAVWQVGLKAMFTNIPDMRKIWRSRTTGQIDDVLAQEWEDITGIGSDWLRHSDLRRVDDFDNPLTGIGGTGKVSKAIQGLDEFNQKGKRAVSALSGMAPVNTALQRITGRAIFNKFAILAQKGGNIAADRRMKALGLDDARLNAIAEQIRNHATFDGKRLKAMNFSSWADQEALAHFESAVFRLGRSIIQENDIGNMAMWMSKPTARTVLQFRSFMLAAWSKQFLQGLNMRDFTTFATFTTTAFLASMTYMLREQLNAIGRSDAKERLEERLSLQKIALAGLQNSSWFTLFAPGLDTAAKSLGYEGVFDARTTQQASDVALGNPTVSLGDSVRSIPGIAGNALKGDFNQQDAQKLRTMLPFQNLMGITQLYNVLVSPLNEKPTRD